MFTVLSGLKKHFNNLTAVVTMADDGGSAGILREEFGILPPGDIRRAIIALSTTDNKTLSDLFGYRFADGKGLSGHSFGNLMITALERITGSFEKAVEEASKILSIQGQVLPVTKTKVSLVAKLEDGSVVRGEQNIDVPKHDGRLQIKKIWLTPKTSVNPKVKKAIAEADAVIIGPGDLYTSLVPNLLVKGVKEALKKTRAKKIYFVNLMTKFGETGGFRASDFVNVLEKYLGRGVLDYVVVNKTKPTVMRFRPYAKEKAEFVELDTQTTKATLIKASLIRKNGFLRHDPDKVADLIKILI